MDERRVVEALVDVCPTCLGLWIDWFDGDIAHLTREAGSPAVYAPASGKAEAPTPVTPGRINPATSATNAPPLAHVKPLVAMSWMS